MWRVLDLFSGIGAFGLGLERAGMRVVAHCELDAFCRRVLAKHWPSVPCHDDVTTREFTEGEADVICGGFPCQDVSAAGKRAGLAGARSGLYRELVRAFRVVRPKILIVENVAALFSDGLGTVLGDLAESRDCGWIEWDSVPASAVGAPHERERVWIVAHADREGRPQPTLSWDVERVRIGNGLEDAPAADAPRQQVGTAGQPQRHERVESSVAADAADAIGPGWPGGPEEGLRRQARNLAEGGAGPEDSGDLGGPGLPRASDPTSLGCGQGWPRRPPDSFARIRDEARRNAADPYGARLAFREGLTRDAWEKLTPAERSRFGNEWQSIWPDEPALSGVDDGDAYELDCIRRYAEQNNYSQAESERDIIVGAFLRAMWEHREIAETSPDLYVCRLHDSVPEMPCGDPCGRWFLGKRIKADEGLRGLWEAFYAAPLNQQELQPGLLQRVRAKKCPKEMDHWLDRVRATGNQVVPQIPQLIGEAIIAAERAA